MSNSCQMGDLAKLTVVTAIIFSLFAVNIASAQSSSSAQSLTTRPLPESPPDLNRAPRTIHRTGTAISGARNSISIKSTDAGIIHRQPPASGCINCGIVDFVNKMGQVGGLNAIAGGVIAGTVARKLCNMLLILMARIIQTRRAAIMETIWLIRAINIKSASP